MILKGSSVLYGVCRALTARNAVRHFLTVRNIRLSLVDNLWRRIEMVDLGSMHSPIGLASPGVPTFTDPKFSSTKAHVRLHVMIHW